ncbi:unnamed protein product, partial [Phaeothamnion confervicola]
MSQQEDVRQRKLQSVYNALESHNFRQAIKLCEKKDLEKWPVTKALKACALARMGRTDEAMDLCREVKTTTPTDEPTINALTYAYRILGCVEETAALMEAACKALPNDRVLLNQLFLCHVRVRDYAKAQQAATRLYRLETATGGGGGGRGGGGRYMLWAAAAMLIQARRGAGGPTMLALAERMVLKILAARTGQPSSGGGGDAGSGGSGSGGNGSKAEPTAEDLMLYVTLLTEQGKLAEALEAVTSSGGGGGAADRRVADTTVSDESSLAEGTIVRMRRAERREVEAGLLLRLGRPVEALEIYEELLANNPDQWSFHTTCFDLALVVGTAVEDYCARQAG